MDVVIVAAAVTLTVATVTVNVMPVNVIGTTDIYRDTRKGVSAKGQEYK